MDSTCLLSCAGQERFERALSLFKLGGLNKGPLKDALRLISVATGWQANELCYAASSDLNFVK